MLFFHFAPCRPTASTDRGWRTWQILGLALALAGPADAARTLKEPRGIKNMRKQPASVTKAALASAGLTSECQGRLRTSEIQGLRCRLAIHAHVSEKIAPTSPARLRQRVRMANEAKEVASSIQKWTPLVRKPNLVVHRYQAHKIACMTAMHTHDTLAAIPRTAPKNLLAARENEAGETLYRKACDCVQASLRLAAKASVPVKEFGKLQGVITSRGCLLDRSKLKTERKQQRIVFTGTAKKLAEANSDESRLMAYAETRDIGLQRCRDRDLRGGTIQDKKSLKKCVCGEIGRWRFPKKKGRPDITLTIPLLGKSVGIEITVTPPGRIKTCGPLNGRLAN